jgi:hypothetical protein
MSAAIVKAFDGTEPSDFKQFLGKLAGSDLAKADKLDETLKQYLAGKPLGGQRAFAFTTGGPAVVRTRPYEGSGQVDENQIFVLALDAQVAPASIARHAWCRAEGINEKIPLRVLEGLPSPVPSPRSSSVRRSS